MADKGLEKTTKHRLKKKDLIMSIFALFSEEYERSTHESIWDIKIPADNVIEYLNTKYEVDYKSPHWLWTQVRRYEEELGVKLFKKVKSGGGKQEGLFSIHYPFKDFFQKQHLYVTEKIKVANGVFDLIQNLKRSKPDSGYTKIILGAGTLCYHLSVIFAESSRDSKTKYFLHTNNLGALEQLISPPVNNENISISVPEGSIDPVTQTIIGKNNEIYSKGEFDYIIQGTSFIYEGDLFIESNIESARKQEILQKTKGTKILVLTKHEFTSDFPVDMNKYGSINNYDFVVVPRKSTDTMLKKKSESVFDEYLKYFKPYIINWNYEIYKVLT